MERQPYESDLAPVVADYGLGVVPYFVPGRGFLTGKYPEARRTERQGARPLGRKYLNERGFAVIAALDEVAQAYSPRRRPPSRSHG